MNGLIALFPGQGSQFVGMGKDLYHSFKIAKETFEEASDSAHLNLKKLCFDGPESDLTLTENTQPCLLTTSVAAFRVAQSELGFKPSIAAGHSLGEYSALVAIGALPLGQAALWVRERGAAMQKAVPAGQGTMAAVMGLEDAVIEKLCAAATEAARAKRAQGESEELTVPAVVEPANFNSPGQVVIAGSVDAVGEAVRMIKSAEASDPWKGGKAIPLQVSAPFHCSLMKPARDRMAELFSASSAKSAVLPSICPYIPNRTGRPTQESGLVYELLIEQVDHPVLWKQSMLAVLEQGYTKGVEFGPGKVLQGLAKRISQAAGKNCTVWGMSDSETLKSLEAELSKKAE